MKKRMLHLIIASFICLGLQHAQAQTVFPPESTVSGSFGVGGSSSYQLTTSVDGRLDLTFTSTNGISMNVNLFAENGTTGLGGSGTNAGPVTWSRDALASGTYIITLNSYYGNQAGSFTLSNHLAAAPVPNDVEPNDDYLHAQVLDQDDSVHGHIYYYDFHHTDVYDWYKLKINEDGMIKLNLTNNSHNGNIVQATLYDSTGTATLGSFTSTNFNTLRKDGLSAGTYYVALTTYYQNGDFAAYTITDSLFTYHNASDAEPNNAPYKAQIFPANSTVTGHENFIYTSTSSDNTDWYKLYYTGDGNLNIVFTQEPHLSDQSLAAVDFKLYNDTTQNAIYSNTFGALSSSVDFTALAQGNYWIKINPSINSSFNFASYSIQNTFVSVVPVTLLNFNVTFHDNNALLSWATTNETNNKGFEIQKSPDALHFAAIGFVNGQTSSSALHSYTFVDPSITSGTFYYRLKQNDYDGNFRYSPIVTIKSGPLEWTILGNASANATVQLQLNKISDVALQIISTNGSILKNIQKGKLFAGTYSFPLEMHNAAAGTYVVRLIINGQAYTKMIMK